MYYIAIVHACAIAKKTTAVGPTRSTKVQQRPTKSNKVQQGPIVGPTSSNKRRGQGEVSELPQSVRIVLNCCVHDFD